MVPRNTDHFHIPFQQTTDDICLYPTIHQHHFFLTCTFIVTNHFLTRYFIYIIDTCIHCFGHIAGFIIKYNFPHHYPMFAKNFGQFTGIDACNARHLLTLQPVGQTFFRIPVTEFFTVITYNNRFGMDTFTLHKSGQAVGFDSKGRHPVITDQRVSQGHQLPRI